MRRTVVLLVLLAAVLLVVADRVVTPLTPVRAAGSALYGTIENAAGSAMRWVGGSSGGDRRLRALEQENAALRADLLAARAQPGAQAPGSARPGAQAPGGAQAGALSGRSDRLDLLAAAVGRHRGVAAHVVGFGRGQSVTVDAGLSAGVARDVTVLNADGLVGRVTWAGPSTATVSLITDAASSVGARMAGSGELGVVTGLPGEGLLRLSLFDPNAPLRAGDEVVTLGSAGARPYVAGVPIGVVTAVESAHGGATRTALVRPAARLSALGLVAVIVPAAVR
ncbi:rod shape-determining protein MreC [Nonomuraea zeae]|uniref:Cell shape-determining protein MreC n=1 Tax=Nonomuraea zeae TaxID=1642303 RepID=A0A5S4F0L0_9ACTN|nr:rod shape-determining protein MreC [Nonomuraea zeae]TMR09382.1 rod shape-determining protein MreC [Nonomuraea zeae]